MKYDLLVAGMALIDSIIKGFHPEPVSASGYTAESASLNVGGEAVNGAVTAAKLGLKTGILCAVGSDAAGSMIRNALHESGVDTELIASCPATPVTTLFVNGDGTRRSITNEAHRVRFHPERYAKHFKETRALSLGSLFRAPFDDAEILRNTVRPAAEAGVTVFADTKLPNFRKLGLSDFRDTLPFLDYITPNEDEARYFTGQTEPEGMADVFLSFGVKNVIIKLGSRGCLLKNREACIRLPGYRVDAVDSTGAGDNFLAGFISQILLGKGQADALRFANACGAVCTTATGATTAIASREQVLQWMTEHEFE